MSRRSFGMIDQLPSGRWRARFTGPDSRRRTAPVTFATRRDADAYLARVHAELLAGNVAAVIPVPVTLAEHAEDWHMLQPVFDADLDQERLARSHAREQQVASKEDA